MQLKPLHENALCFVPTQTYAYYLYKDIFDSPLSSAESRNSAVIFTRTFLILLCLPQKAEIVLSAEQLTLSEWPRASLPMRTPVK